MVSVANLKIDTAKPCTGGCRKDVLARRCRTMPNGTQTIHAVPVCLLFPELVYVTKAAVLLYLATSPSPEALNTSPEPSCPVFSAVDNNGPLVVSYSTTNQLDR